MDRNESGQITGGRDCYTSAKKLNILALLEEMKSEEGLSLTHTAAVIHIDPTVPCRCWGLYSLV